MNIQSKMKTRDAKNNPVTAVLVSVLVMFLLSCLFLLLLAALLYKFDLSESAGKVGCHLYRLRSDRWIFHGKDHENTEIFMGICSGSHLFLHFIPDISAG